MDDVPFEAPVMAVARLKVGNGEDHVKKPNEIVCKYRRVVEGATRPWKMLCEWRVDCEEGKRENVMVTGWESREAYLMLKAKMRRENEEYRSLRERYEGGVPEVWHCWDLEK